MLTFDDVIKVLQQVKDPEISTISVVELGMIEDIHIEQSVVKIDVLPTFIGCPALDIIKNNIEKAVKAVPFVTQVQVSFLKSPPWTSDRVTEFGRERLKEFGIAPPPKKLESDGSWTVNCPYCDSVYTTLDNLFGPTACRSILYCKNCKNPFEAMKPISTLL